MKSEKSTLELCLCMEDGEDELTGIDQKGMVLGFTRYLKSAIISFPIKRCKGWRRPRSLMIANSSARVNQSCM